MVKNFRRTLSFIMSAALIISSAGVNSFAAENVTDKPVIEQESIAISEEDNSLEDIISDESNEEVVIEDVDEVSETDSSEEEIIVTEEAEDSIINDLADNYCGPTAKYELDADGTLTITGTGEITSNPWKKDSINDVKKVIIDEGITQIGSSIFYYHSNITEVSFPDSLITIGGSAFENTDLRSVIIPENVTTIGEKTFNGCSNLKTVEVKSTVLDPIGTEGSFHTIFKGCSISTVKLSAKMTYIPENLFIDATFDDAEITIPDNVTEIRNGAFWRSTGLKALKFGEGSKLKKIGLNAFRDVDLEKIEFPKTLEEIGGYAFNSNKLITEVVIPENVTTLLWASFANCTKLTKVTIKSDKLSNVEGSVFYNCNLNDVTLGSSMPEIPDYLFDSAAFQPDTSITIPANVTRIGKNAFAAEISHFIFEEGSKLETIDESAFAGTLINSIDLPSSLVTIGDRAFAGAKLTSITIPENVTTIGVEAFHGCNTLSSVTVNSNKITSVGDNRTGNMWQVFEDCVIRNVSFGSNVTKIPVCMFYRASFKGCKLTIPSTVTEIGAHAFNLCDIEEVTIPTSVKTIGDYAFRAAETKPAIKVYVVKGSKGYEWATLHASEYNLEVIATIPSADAPTASVPSGVVKKGSTVALSTDSIGAYIYYTTDGSTPDVNDDRKTLGTTKLYEEEFTINDPVTIKAIAFGVDYKKSAVSSFTYTINTSDWGDVEKESSKLLDAVKAWTGNDSNALPSTVWYVFGNDIDGYFFFGEKVTAVTADYATGPINITKIYTGEKITFNDEVFAFYGNKKLIENRDYTISYANNVNVAAKDAAKAPAVKIKGKGSYNKQSDFKFTIAKRSMNDVDSPVTLSSESIVTVIAGNKKLSSVKPKAEFNGKKLTLNKDYELVYYEGSIADSNVKDPRAVTLSDTNKTYLIQIKETEKGNFKGELNQTVTVKTVNAADAVLASKLKVTTSAGKALSVDYAEGGIDLAQQFSTGKWVVKNGTTPLSYGTDYAVEPANGDDSKSAGKHKFVVIGNGTTIFGTKTVAYTITGQAMKNVRINGLSTGIEYTGKPITLNDLKAGSSEITLKNASGYTLQEGKDYKVSKLSSGAVATGSIGKFSLVFTGINGYNGTIKKTITVKGKNVSGLEFTLEETKVPYTKAGATPKVKPATYNGKTLIENVDYTVSYKNNKKVLAAGGKTSPTAVIKGIGTYAGTKNLTFAIEKTGLENVQAVCNDVKAGGKTALVTPKLYDNGKALTVGKNKDVEKIAKTDITYVNHVSGEVIGANDKVQVGTVIDVTVNVTCSAKSSYKAGDYTLTTSYRVIAADKDISKYSVGIKAGSKSKLTVKYGEPITLNKSDFEFKLGGKVYNMALKNFTIESITNNSRMGTATVILKGTGEFGGTKKVTFKITAASM